MLCSIVDSDEALDTRSLFATITTLAVAVLGFLVYKQKTARPVVCRLSFDVLAC
jgi:hypothetical protein